jgi:hypothetical protein
VNGSTVWNTGIAIDLDQGACEGVAKSFEEMAFLL